MSGNVLARLGDPSSLGADLAPALRERDAGERPASAAAPAAFVARDAASSTGTGAEAHAREAVPLTSLPRDATGVVAGVRVGTAGAATDPALERMALRLIEIGFVQGAQLRVIAFGQPGNDPIGVRVGGRGGVSTFALRRLEAACVWVWLDSK